MYSTAARFFLFTAVSRRMKKLTNKQYNVHSDSPLLTINRPTYRSTKIVKK